MPLSASVHVGQFMTVYANEVSKTAQASVPASEYFMRTRSAYSVEEVAGMLITDILYVSEPSDPERPNHFIALSDHE